MICWHKWKIAHTEILPSWIEQVGAEKIKSVDCIKTASHKEAIVSFKCEKCGREKVERI